ncbi:MAG: hypothetical protein COB48_13080 [Pseudoalteromonas sp.]|nr:MAG: hypothetical protein COB48_13080 [Pseudoalteromonas sp.]
MEKTIKFKKWCSERMGHPIGVELARDAVRELELENRRLMESNSKLQNKSGESFKEELLKATSSMMHPHIEGVYAVWEKQL